MKQDAVLEKLNSSNYQEWSVQLKLPLNSKSLWSIESLDKVSRNSVENAAAFQNRVTTMIIKHLEKLHSQWITTLLKKWQTAFVAWDAIGKWFSKQSVGNLNTWRDAFGTLILEEGKDVGAHIKKLKSYRTLLKGSTAPVSEGEMILRVMKSTSNSWIEFSSGLIAK